LRFNAARFNQLVETQTVLRSLTEAVVFDGSGRLLARAGLGRLLSFQPQIPSWAVDRAREGKVVILTAGTDDRVHALVELDSFNDIFLYVGRPVDQRVLAHMDRSQGAAKLYEEMEGQRSDLQIRFAMIFVVVALLLLLAGRRQQLEPADREPDLRRREGRGGRPHGPGRSGPGPGRDLLAAARLQ
jgi:two-component system nitrogen regulation sensor histidine kinase NtrY